MTIPLANGSGSQPKTRPPNIVINGQPVVAGVVAVEAAPTAPATVAVADVKPTPAVAGGAVLPSVTIQSSAGHMPQIYVVNSEAAPPAEPAAPLSKVAAPPPPPPPLRGPHPLLWVALAISILALVLGVPKGSIPTLTGRHKALRAQELLVHERLAVLSQLAGLLPPPLAALLGANTPSAVDADLEVLRLGTGLQLWSAADARWWTLDDLGAGASIVRGAGGAEIWLVNDANAENAAAGSPALLAALTASLVARERAAAELDVCRARECVCPVLPDEEEREREREKEREKEEEKEADRRKDAAEDRRRLREREGAVEARERSVARREGWVLDAMRKLGDRAHNEAERSLEDHIAELTERLRGYQRELHARDA